MKQDALLAALLELDYDELARLVDAHNVSEERCCDLGMLDIDSVPRYSHD